MKKLLTYVIVSFSSTIIYAQDATPKAPAAPQLSFDNNSTIDGIFHILPIALFVILIIQVLKYFLDHKLKNKINR